MLPAYMQAKKQGELNDFLYEAIYHWLFTFPEDSSPGRKPLDQQSYRLLSVVYSRDYEEDPQEDINRFLRQSLPDDSERLRRRDTLADLTLSGHLSVRDNLSSISTY